MALSDMQSLLVDQFDEASYQYGCGNFAAAAALFKDLVAMRYAPAATSLSQLYLNGEGVPRDPATAVELLEKGIAWGDANAAWNLAAIYHSGGFGVPHDAAKSREYFLKAKQLGCTLPIDDFVREGG